MTFPRLYAGQVRFRDGYRMEIVEWVSGRVTCTSIVYLT